MQFLAQLKWCPHCMGQVHRTDMGCTPVITVHGSVAGFQYILQWWSTSFSKSSDIQSARAVTMAIYVVALAGSVISCRTSRKRSYRCIYSYKQLVAVSSDYNRWVQQFHCYFPCGHVEISATGN